MLPYYNAGVELYYQLKHPFNLMQGMEICVEDGTTSPTHSKSVSSCSSSGLSTTSKLETSLPVSLF
jgi:hypothetical protein